MGGFVTHRPGAWLDPATCEEVAHQDLLARMARQRVVLLGETHDRFDIHRWQLHVAAGLLALRGNIVLGFEMFPRRVQPVLDAWAAGQLDTETFLAQSDWDVVWRFDPDLYLPLFQFCRQFGVPMRALNCYRSLVTRVGKEGWDAVPVDERDGLTPARPASPEYRRYLFDITGGGRAGREVTDPQDPAFNRFVRAQQTWDRAFACNIAAALAAPDAPLVIGIIGRGHLEYRHGTPFQLADLGVSDVSVLLPSDAEHFDMSVGSDLADAIFRLASRDGLLR